MSDEITDYIAIQKSSNQIEIQLKPYANFDYLSMTGFNNLWQSKNIQLPKLDIKPYTHVPSATKLRRIYRQFN